MKHQDHVIRDPRILYGRPIIKGTRIGIAMIIDKLAAGESVNELLSAYPHITEEQVRACLDYATAVIRNDDEGLL